MVNRPNPPTKLGALVYRNNVRKDTQSLTRISFSFLQFLLLGLQEGAYGAHQDYGNTYTTTAYQDLRGQ